MAADAARAPKDPFSGDPPIQPYTLPYWKAASAGRLVLNRCRPCDRAFFYPRAHCPFCGGDQTEWIESSGRGKVYSYTIVRRGLPQPQATAYVTLEEGPTLLTAIEREDLDAIRIGDAVRAKFRPGPDGRPFLVFIP